MKPIKILFDLLKDVTHGGDASSVQDLEVDLSKLRDDLNTLPTYAARSFTAVDTRKKRALLKSLASVCFSLLLKPDHAAPREL
jgi:hypothetical protein